MTRLDKDLDTVIRNLDQWISRNGWAGWDPYDIKSKKWVLRITAKSSGNFFYRILREGVFESFYHFPLSFRKLLGIQPRVNAKAMGLLATAYLRLFRKTGDQAFYDRAMECLDWLRHHRSPGTTGSGWGYPFDWFSSKLVPAETPNGIVTTAVGEAFWQAWKLTGDRAWLNECINIAHFLASLPRHEALPGTICFSYTPLFINHVHNLNLFVAEYLIRLGKETNNQGWIDLGMQATDYTLACQRPDGSFDYNGPPEKPANFVDHYHTGFVLRMLFAIWQHTGKPAIRKALDHCFHHYHQHFFEAEGIPKLMPGRKYRIDIHSCAEALICLSTLGDLYPDSVALKENVYRWTTHNLLSRKGYFYYGILKSRFTRFPFKSKIPYLRWGQAWMMLALSLMLNDKKNA